jgi:hypothetical protein
VGNMLLTMCTLSLEVHLEMLVATCESRVIPWQGYPIREECT